MGFSIDLSVFNPKGRPLIGVDVSPSGVKLVELAESGRGRFRLERYAMDTLPRDAVSDGNVANLDAVADAIRRCWKRLSTTTRNAAMAVPASAVITKKISVPAGQREHELEALVESEANQYIPFALDEVNLDFQVVGESESGEEMEVLIAASRKDKVEDRVAAAESAGLKPTVMDVESYAALAAFELLDLPLDGMEPQNALVAYVDVGSQVTSASILKAGQPIYFREQNFGGNLLTDEVMRSYGMGLDEAEQAKRSGDLPDNYEQELLRPFMENLGGEVARALQFFYSSTQYNHVDLIVLAGGCAAMPGVDKVVQGRTQVPTVVADPFARMEVASTVRKTALKSDAPALMVACGLALRRFDE